MASGATGQGQEQTRLVYGRRLHIDYPEDVARIVAIFAARGFVVSPEDAQSAYEEYSEQEWAAGWISMSPDDADVFYAVRRYLAPVSGSPL